MRIKPSYPALLLAWAIWAAHAAEPAGLERLARSFADPPASARPGVYWYFLDGNSDRQAMTEDLESMARAEIGSVLFLEVNLGVTAGPVKFMSDAWQENFVHAVREAERLGLELTLGSGPGWAGSGGPWVKPEESMLHLVASAIQVEGPARLAGPLPIPAVRKPYFPNIGPNLEKRRAEFYRDTFVLAFPTPKAAAPIADLDEKALYYRAPYTSAKGVKPFLPEPKPDGSAADNSGVAKDKIIEVTRHLRSDGTLDWAVPRGAWTIMRFGERNNGASTRPAPAPGYGFEADKFSTAALDAHLANYTDKLLAKVGPRKPGAGWTMLHIDSWEMGAQNWTPKFRDEFHRRRGYDPLPYFPAYTGVIVGTREITERFLWDVRLTGQELVLEQHAGHLKAIAHRAGMTLSIEPYDMNPTADLAYGAVADQPMGEFWTQGGFNSSFSCIEAASIAHTTGRTVVGAESFTSAGSEAMAHFPGDLKNQADWAFAAGINRLVIHTFPHQPLGPGALPGMAFGRYGVHWQRNQTWWPMVPAFHRYIARCSHMLRQGTSVADILYLTPEGAPHVFRPPPSAVAGDDPFLPDRKGYNFDGCAPETLLAGARVEDGNIAFPNGTAYRILVLPACETMTPALLNKIASLVRQGATVVGSPPRRSPSLSNYPACDHQVASAAEALWGSLSVPPEVSSRTYGKGRIFWGGGLHLPAPEPPGDLYPSYDAVAAILREQGVAEDFVTEAELRYTHRQTADADIYFVANRADRLLDANCTFRAAGGEPERWDPLTGQSSRLRTFFRDGRMTRVPLRFEPRQSFFVVFPRRATAAATAAKPSRPNFDAPVIRATLAGPWQVSFDPKVGGPDQIEFTDLQDWTQRSEEGIRYYSGIATYRKTFDIPEDVLEAEREPCLDLGRVNDICRVRLNGHDLGVIWTAPWRVAIGAIAKPWGNELEIEVANRWANRLIGDEQAANRNVRTLEFPSGLLAGQPVKAGRHTFLTARYFRADSALLPSGLLGPVTLQTGRN